MGLFTKSEQKKAEEQADQHEEIQLQQALVDAPQKAIWLFNGNTDDLNNHLALGWEFVSACPTPSAAGGDSCTTKSHACLVIIKRSTPA